MSDEPETNPLRTYMIRNVIAQHHDEPTTLENLAKYLPETFGLCDEDLAPFTETKQAAATLLSEVEFEGDAPTLAEAQGATAESTAAPVVEAEPHTELPTPDEIEAAIIRRIEADQHLANARAVLIVATNAEKTARSHLAEAVSRFQSGSVFKPLTPEQLRRQFVQEQQRIREAIARGDLPPPRRQGGIGKSAIDRMAAAQRGGNPAFAGRGYARGALPANMKNASNYDPRRGPTAKLPSEL